MKAVDIQPSAHNFVSANIMNQLTKWRNGSHRKQLCSSVNMDCTCWNSAFRVSCYIASKVIEEGEVLLNMLFVVFLCR